MDYCQFALVHEGPSDSGLVAVLERMLIKAGFDEVYGEARQKVGSVEDSLTGMAKAQECYQVVFVHRDADNAGRAARQSEIESAAEAVNWTDGEAPRVVPVIPITMTEAWLLLDEGAIRAVCGNARGDKPLELPKVREIENIADPKSVLFDALRAAAPNRGRRQITDQEVGTWRSRLLERLDIHGQVTHLAGWLALEDDVAAIWAHHSALRGGR
ncbi:DUF4276 family protein [Microbacterium marinum]|uniref:hypothetical protein n=1 Tax=Microbacterium marinum TaxID=421115 RepID=UPI00384DB58C